MLRLIRRLILFVLLSLLLLFAIFIYEKYLSKTHNRNELIIYGNVDVKQVDISFRVAGQVAQLVFEEGDLVRKGDLMALLDKNPYFNQYQQSQANLNNLQASFNNASTLLKRRKELIDVGGVSQEDLNNAQSNYDQLEAQVIAAEASLAIAHENLSYTMAYAPTDGVILSRIREPGTVVRETDPIYTLSISSPVWIRAYIDEIHLGQINYGMEAEVTTDNPYGHAYTGKVGFISPIAEFTPKTVETTQLRTDLVYRLRIYIDNPDSGLRQGMPVTVKFKFGDTDRVEKK